MLFIKENIIPLPVSPPRLEIQDNSLICRIKKSGELNMVWINIVELFNSVYTSYTEIGNTCRQYTVYDMCGKMILQMNFKDDIFWN